jgi:pyridoxal phosphate enzyme (YggS family)
VDTTSAASLMDRYRQVCERVAQAAADTGRRPDDIVVVAVTKYAELEQIRELIRAGHRDFGESRVQQLLQRAAIIGEHADRQRLVPRAGAEHGAGELGGVRWHMIGHLQRNKVRKTIEVARLVHSVDSLRLAEEIQQAAFKRDEVSEVLVQVNCSGEASKFGCAVPAAQHLCDQINTMVHVRVRGLMTMAPLSDEPGDAETTFRRCRELFEEIRTTGISDGRFDILSMGMSNDYEVAVRCGANMVRVGQAIFGPGPAEED